METFIDDKINSVNNESDHHSASVLLANEQLKDGIWPYTTVYWMTAFYVALFIIRPWEVLFPSLAAINFERLYVIVMIVAVANTKRAAIESSFQTSAVVLFLIAIGISGLFALDPSLSWSPFYDYVSLVIFYFILIKVITTPYELFFMVACYIMTMLVYLWKAEWEFFVNGQHRYDMGVIRMFGIEHSFGGPNSLAMSIVTSLPMLLLLWNLRNNFTFTWSEFWKKWFSRALILYLCLAVSATVLTNSRSGMSGFILFILLVAVTSKASIAKKMGYFLTGVVLLLVIWQFMPKENQERFSTIWNPDAGPKNAQVSAEGRIEGYKAGIDMFNKFPIKGVGVGNFIYYRTTYGDGIELNAHNLAGQVLGETGIIGAAAFIIMISTTLYNCRTVRKLSDNQDDSILSSLSGLAVACRNSLLLLSFEGFFGHNLLRFNWLWLAAFSLLAVRFAQARGKLVGNKNKYGWSY